MVLLTYKENGHGFIFYRLISVTDDKWTQFPIPLHKTKNEQ